MSNRSFIIAMMDLVFCDTLIGTIFFHSKVRKLRRYIGMFNMFIVMVNFFFFFFFWGGGEGAGKRRRKREREQV